jgi:serine/threonine protein kinase
VIYCINPWCHSRTNKDDAVECSSCRSPLLINNRFKLLKPLFDLNQNRSFDVYEVLDTTGSWLSPPNTTKILKVLKEYDDEGKLVSLIQKEAETLQLLNHPCIPKCDLDDLFSIDLEYGPGELHCLAMTKIEGITLDTWIKQHGKASQSLALDWFRQLIQILDIVHFAGINKLFDGFIHRDIKPTNIIVQPDNRLALIDFGGARRTSNTYYAKLGGGNRDRLTQLGTLGYIAPEQQDGRAVLQSDFFSLGYTFVNLLTGKEFGDIPRDEKTGLLRWQQYATQIDKPFLQYIEGLTSPAIARRPKSTKEILAFLDETLPAQLRWHRVFKSKLFKFGCLFLTALVLLGGLHFWRFTLAEQNFNNGLQQLNSSRFTDARQSFERSIALNPSYEAYANLGLLCDRAQDRKCTLDSYTKAIALNPTDYAAYYNLGSYHEDRGDFTKAIAAYRKSIEVSKGQAPEPLNNLARLLIVQKRYPEAQKLIEKGLVSTQDQHARSILLKNLGWIYFAQKEYLKSEGILRRSIVLELSITSSHCLLAQVLEAQKKPSKAQWKLCLSIQGEDASSSEVSQWRSIPIDRLMNNI